ncbi:purine operon repressor, PurR [Clostridium collagenovorans DSM 3089]|uniref:Purine operon repressor, PurR n=1 Tax=Clostridium collagenovorans DSM 3089 TaxID=1121306 RepID=A0A1M5Y8W3_9CLOT|nr:pur operon repressor [Clostridium collagenovorans]SHI08278.1 purine operon repressor, PurR [Clostridium collagenovorans DSM 3089]
MEQKFNRNQRIAAITKVLVENPNKIINLNRFTELLNAAKSTISEDIVIVRESLSRLSMGKIETISGAAGGVKFISEVSKEQTSEFVDGLCNVLMGKDRVVPGDFIYITDILSDPNVITQAGSILASKFNSLEVDYVVTIETKGIPLAYEVAKILGVKLIIVRRDPKVTEGPTVSINYVSGSSKKIQTMSLARKSINKGSKCLFIDDFMKGGGTASGIRNLLHEFECELVGIGVLIDDADTPRKLFNEYMSLLQFNGIDENGGAILSPSNL